MNDFSITEDYSRVVFPTILRERAGEMARIRMAQKPKKAKKARPLVAPKGAGREAARELPYRVI